jgi:hypothetical protein
MMESIQKEALQPLLERFVGGPVYIHLETTNGAYAATGMLGQKQMAVCAFIRNGKVEISRAQITGEGPFRAGLEIDGGWIYAEGLTDWELDDQGRLLMAGHDQGGRLAICLELSRTPFPI